MPREEEDGGKVVSGVDRRPHIRTAMSTHSSALKLGGSRELQPRIIPTPSRRRGKSTVTPGSQGCRHRLSHRSGTISHHKGSRSDFPTTQGTVGGGSKALIQKVVCAVAYAS